MLRLQEVLYPQEVLCSRIGAQNKASYKIWEGDVGAQDDT